MAQSVPLRLPESLSVCRCGSGVGLFPDADRVEDVVKPMHSILESALSRKLHCDHVGGVEENLPVVASVRVGRFLVREREVAKGLLDQIGPGRVACGRTFAPASRDPRQSGRYRTGHWAWQQACATRDHSG